MEASSINTPVADKVGVLSRPRVRFNTAILICFVNNNYVRIKTNPQVYYKQLIYISLQSGTLPSSGEDYSESSPLIITRENKTRKLICFNISAGLLGSN